MLSWLLTFFISEPILLSSTTETKTEKAPHRPQIYQPPNRKVRQQTRTSGGSRGNCPTNIDDRITLLVPGDHIPLTTLPYPTFIWYQEQQISLPVKFTIIESGEPKPLFTKELEKKHSGLVSLTLPQDVPSLEIGKNYRWSVSIICNRLHPSMNPYAEASIEKIALPSFLSSSLTLTSPNLSNCNEYAQAGIWYDALSCGIKQSNFNEDFSTINYLNNLLNQVDLGYTISYIKTLLSY